MLFNGFYYIMLIYEKYVVDNDFFLLRIKIGIQNICNKNLHCWTIN